MNALRKISLGLGLIAIALASFNSPVEAGLETKLPLHGHTRKPRPITVTNGAKRKLKLFLETAKKHKKLAAIITTAGAAAVAGLVYLAVTSRKGSVIPPMPPSAKTPVTPICAFELTEAKTRKAIADRAVTEAKAKHKESFSSTLEAIRAKSHAPAPTVADGFGAPVVDPTPGAVDKKPIHHPLEFTGKDEKDWEGQIGFSANTSDPTGPTVVAASTSPEPRTPAGYKSPERPTVVADDTNTPEPRTSTPSVVATRKRGSKRRSPYVCAEEAALQNNLQEMTLIEGK